MRKEQMKKEVNDGPSALPQSLAMIERTVAVLCLLFSGLLEKNGEGAADSSGRREIASQEMAAGTTWKLNCL